MGHKKLNNELEAKKLPSWEPLSNGNYQRS